MPRVLALALMAAACGQTLEPQPLGGEAVEGEAEAEAEGEESEAEAESEAEGEADAGVARDAAVLDDGALDSGPDGGPLDAGPDGAADGGGPADGT